MSRKPSRVTNSTCSQYSKFMAHYQHILDNVHDKPESGWEEFIELCLEQHFTAETEQFISGGTTRNRRKFAIRVANAIMDESAQDLLGCVGRRNPCNRYLRGSKHLCSTLLSNGDYARAYNEILIVKRFVSFISENLKEKFHG